MRAAASAVLVLVLSSAGCVSTGFDGPVTRPPRSMLTGDTPRAHVSVREATSEVELVAGPFAVPPSSSVPGVHDHQDDAMKSPMIYVPWPVDGGLTGFRMAVYDSTGAELPRDLLHHVIGVNFARRQLVYPVPERILGFGTETPDIKLPGFLEVPLARGDSLGIYAMWNNPSDRELTGVFVKVVLPYATNSAERQKALPVYFDTNNNIGGKTSYDLPPGRSERAFEFDLPVAGGLLAASGHLHDFGVELRLEEAESGRVLTRLKPDRDDDGRVTGVQQRIYRRFFKLVDARIRLEAGTRYRVVGVYDNPTGETIPDGGMAHVVGLFSPDDPQAWPDLDPSLEAYRVDVSALPPPFEDAHVHH